MRAFSALLLLQFVCGTITSSASAGGGGSGDFGAGYGMENTFPVDEGYVSMHIQGRADPLLLRFHAGAQDQWSIAAAFVARHELHNDGCDRECATAALATEMRQKIAPLSSPVSMFRGAPGPAATPAVAGGDGVTRWVVGATPAPGVTGTPPSRAGVWRAAAPVLPPGGAAAAGTGPSVERWKWENRGFAAVSAVLARLDKQAEHWDTSNGQYSCPRNRHEAETRSGFFMFAGLAADFARVLRERLERQQQRRGEAGGRGRRFTVCETGFGVGHSAAVALGASDGVDVVSFDLFDSTAKREALGALQELYPAGRLRAVPGVLPGSLREFVAREAGAVTCDVIFVDVHGGQPGSSDAGGEGALDVVQLTLLASLAPPEGALLFHDELLPMFDRSWEPKQRTGLLLPGTERCGRDAVEERWTNEEGCTEASPCTRAVVTKYCIASVAGTVGRAGE